MDSKTYRVTFTRGDATSPCLYTRVDFLDQFTDLDASTNTEEVYEFLIAEADTAHFERDLDASPAVVRWEEITGNWPKHIR